MHEHGAVELAPPERARVRAVLAAVTIPLLLATLVGLALLWPRGETPEFTVRWLRRADH